MALDLPEDEYFAALQRQFERTPALNFIKQRLEALSPGRARVVLEPSDSYLNGGGVIHGGIVATVLDSVGWFACATQSGGYWLFTAEFKINFLDVATETVIATGEVLRKGSDLFHARMDARTAGDRHVATALGTFMIIPRTFRL